MSDEPTPPDEIPNSVAGGLQRQAIPILRAIIQHCEKLIIYLEESEGGIESDDDVVNASSRMLW